MFYEFNQNNSGGDFDHDPEQGISHWVIIEAPDIATANTRAKSIGLYFDGCSSGRDCSCCGDRWSEAYGEGTEQPQVYNTVVGPNEPTTEKDLYIKWIKGPEGYIHYLNGTVSPFWENPKPKKATSTTA